MELGVQSGIDGSNIGVLQVSDKVFAEPYNEALVHQIVVASLAQARSGTSAQKARSEVRGGGAKPFRQKGTGRARAGTSRNPIWRGGGQTFAGKTRDYSQKVNRKMYRKALRVILSELARSQRLRIVDDLKLDRIKTKDLVERLAQLEVGKALLVCQAHDSNLWMSAQNLQNVDVLIATKINPVGLINTEQTLMTQDALKQIEEWLG